MDNLTEDIVKSMIYIQDKIDIKEKELNSLRDIYYKYKNYLKQIYPDEDIDIIEYLTKQKILKRGMEDAKGEFRKSKK